MDGCLWKVGGRDVFNSTGPQQTFHLEPLGTRGSAQLVERCHSLLSLSPAQAQGYFVASALEISVPTDDAKISVEVVKIQTLKNGDILFQDCADGSKRWKHIYVWRVRFKPNKGAPLGSSCWEISLENRTRLDRLNPICQHSWTRTAGWEKSPNSERRISKLSLCIIKCALSLDLIYNIGWNVYASLPWFTLNIPLPW